ncbi:MAG TPA: hypothetical protein VEU51_07955 [Candidatus Acidoferrales bacterium]|nr:hypothetical protein [Candidatus Acidoferrales bacterium]
MRSIRHPLSGALYDLQTDGTVRVEHNGKSGLFRADGTYISGEIQVADPQLCVWIGGRNVATPSRHSGGAIKQNG